MSVANLHQQDISAIKVKPIRTELEVSLERPRRHSDPRFEQLRATLLDALGI